MRKPSKSIKSAKQTNTINIPKILLMILLGFLAIGAIAGGIGLILSVINETALLPPEYLKNSPFDTVLIPGIILFIFIGIIPAITTYGLISKKKCKILEYLNLYPDRHWSFAYSIYSAIILIVWLDFEILFIGYHILQFIYILVAVAILIATLHPRNFYDLQENKK
jgi:hypothetical protein